MTRDVSLHDTTIPEGSAVLLVTGAATRDERMFPEPDRVDIDRERKMGFNLALGYGIHSCLGAALARMESRIALEALLDLIPEYEVDRDGLRRVAMSNVSGGPTYLCTLEVKDEVLPRGGPSRPAGTVVGEASNHEGAHELCDCLIVVHVDVRRRCREEGEQDSSKPFAGCGHVEALRTSPVSLAVTR